MANPSDILEVLISQGVIDEAAAEGVRKEMVRSGLPVEKALEKFKLAGEDDILRARANLLGVPYIDVAGYIIDLELIAVFPEELAKKHNAVPLFKIGETITVAMADPNDVPARDHIRKALKMNVEPVLSSQKAILKVIDSHYGTSSESMEAIVKVIEDERLTEADEKNMAAIAEETPVIKLVNFIIMQAVKDRASDIHIEPEEDALRIRDRIDGVLQETNSLPLKLQRAITSRIKIMAMMDISENRRGQDGRIRMKVMGKDIDLRVSTFPTVHGENVVMRILDKSSLAVSLKDIGLPPEDLERFSKLIHQPNGIVLVTGPTGSGKTTTLYSALATINTIDNCIVTVEDPVEYEIPLIRQCNVNPKADITFASGLRIILRQDPDIIMVGEVRDAETATIAIQAALTGHLVFSTLHTNDAPSAATRLMDMGIEPFLISSSIIGVLAQRLVRAICPGCRQAYVPPDQVLKEYGFAPGTQLYQGKGCDKCKGTGYKGRRGIYELMIMTVQLRRMIEARKSSDELKKEAQAAGMKNLRENGFELVKAGVTTIEEVLRVTREEI